MSFDFIPTTFAKALSLEFDSVRILYTVFLASNCGSRVLSEDALERADDAPGLDMLSFVGDGTVKPLNRPWICGNIWSGRRKPVPTCSEAAMVPPTPAFAMLHK